MTKNLNLNTSVYDLAHTYDDFLDVMESLGFSHMRECIRTKPEHTRGVTIPIAAANHNVPLKVIMDAFEAAGYTVQ